MLSRRNFLNAAGAATVATLSPASLLAEQRLLPTRMIPGSEEALPIIGMGMSAAFRSGDREASWNVIRTFQDHGSRYIDVSGSGRFLVADIAGEKGLKNSVFLGSYFSAADDAGSRADAARLLEITGKSSLDLMHAYTENAVPNWDVMKRWKEDGLTRHIGVARHNRKHYDAMMGLMKTGTVDFLQVNYSLLETESADRVLPMAMEKGVAVTINRPFINGDYFDIVRGHELPEWAADFDCESWAQFSLKFILAHPAVNCVLTETANPKHALDNLGAGFGRLPDEKERQKMLALIRTFSRD
jgi:diketogulonate reductase-like aldo/keto reductase